MALHFHKLRVSDIQKDTKDCVVISFEIPTDLQETFHYLPGQNITLRHNDGEELRRSYSICSNPSDKKFSVAVKKVDQGIFSSFANGKLKKGDVLEVMPPSGAFTLSTDINVKKQYVFFAAGSGITPIISIIKSALLAEPQSLVTLVYGNRNVSSIIFKEKLEGLKDLHLERFRIFYVLSREKTEAAITTGRIDQEKCEQLASVISYKEIDEFFICGPEEMIFTVRDFLLEKNVSSKKIHFELFNTPVRKRFYEKKNLSLKSGSASEVTVKLDGRSFNFSLERDSNNILDAALAVGADVPYSCKGGVCTTCKSRLVEGKIEMETNYGLEPDEVAAGFILTCQSHPRSEKVVIDFDVKS